MLKLRSLALRATAYVFILLSLFGLDAVLAQSGPISSPFGGERADENPLTQLRQRLQQSATSGGMVAMEGAVDPDAYVVGPGDVFMVSIGGAQPTAVAVPVSADGRLILPEGSVIQADSRVLRAVREQALRALQNSYRNVAVDVSLSQPRQFYVHVSGAVPVPGRYLALPTARVSDLLQLAFSDTTAAPVSNELFRPSLRNVTVTRRDSSVLRVDVARYLSTGETEANPYVRDGDVINVPAYKVTDHAVFVNGAVPFPGTYDYRPGDTVADLIRVAGATDNYTGIGIVRLARQHGDGSLTTTTYSASELRQGADRTPLQPLDHISLQPTRVSSGIAEVEGYVQFPGRYSIEPGRTTLQDLIEMAGGFRPDALVRGSYLVRDVLPTPRVPSTAQNRFEERMLDLATLRADTIAIMQYLRQSELDFISRTQFAQGLRIQNRVSLDMPEALQEGAPPVYLQDKDRLVVPHDRNGVFVFGQVQRPGYVPYQAGGSVSEYIAMAGGRSSLGDRAHVIEATTGRYLADGAAPQSGDMIYVDSRRDVADTAELQRLVLEESRARSQERIQWLQAAAQSLFTLVSVISLYVTLRN